MADLSDLIFDDAQDNMGGTQLIAYYALAEDIATLPGTKAAPATMGDHAIIDQDIVMKPGASFKKLYASPDSGKVDDNKVDGKDVNTYESIYEFFFPKNDTPALGFMRLGGTSRYVVLVPEADGNVRMLGSKPGVPATLISVAATSGTNSTGDKGATFQFKSFQNGPAPVYQGTMPPAEGGSGA